MNGEMRRWELHCSGSCVYHDCSGSAVGLSYDLILLMLLQRLEKLVAIGTAGLHSCSVYDVDYLE